MNKGIYTALGIAILALVLGGVACFQSTGRTFSGQLYEYDKVQFVNGLFAGNARTPQFEIDKSGNATSSGRFAITGTSLFETLTQGGGLRATSTDDTTATLLPTDFDVENVIAFTPNVTGITLSLPATTTSGMSSIVPNASDCRDLTIYNATTTAGASFTLGGGTGTLLRKASSTAAVLPGGAAVLRICRKGDTDIIANFYSTI